MTPSSHLSKIEPRVADSRSISVRLLNRLYFDVECPLWDRVVPVGTAVLERAENLMEFLYDAQ